MAILAVEILRISYGKGQSSHSCRTAEQLCVAYASLIDTLGEVSFEALLSYDICKTHLFLVMLVVLSVAQRHNVREFSEFKEFREFKDCT